jgi:predicted anti-sigma-YlaC factor YlaD
MSALPEMPCAEFVERVTDYLEDALDAVDRRRLEEHLDACRHCREYLDQLRTTLRLCGALTPDDVTDGMRADLVTAFARWRDGG